MRGRRVGLRPDICAWIRRPARGGGHHIPRAHLMDIKTCLAGNPHYRAAGLRGERASAVERRARLVPGEYRTRARACDHRMAVRAAVAAGGRESDVPPLGPRYPGAAVTAHLATFPEPEGLVVGSYGEANRGVTDFVSRCGRAAGEREWRSMGARTASEAASIITAQMLRSLSVRVHSGHMRVLYARLRYVGMSAAQAATHTGGGEAGGGETGGG